MFPIGGTATIAALLRGINALLMGGRNIKTEFEGNIPMYGKHATDAERT